MPLPFLESLNLRAREAWPFIQAGVRQGLAFSRIDDAIRTGLGTSIRNSVLRELIRREKSIQEYGRALRSLPAGLGIDVTRLPEALTTLRRKYSYNMEVQGFNTATGELMVRNVTLTTDNPNITRSRLEEQAAELVNRGENYGMEVVNVNLMSALRAGFAGTF